MDDFKRGFIESIGLSTAVLMFGILFAAAAFAKGISFEHTMWLSIAVFAGSAQFTALAVWGDGTNLPLLTVVISGFLITSRHIFMGLSMGHVYNHLPIWKRLPSLFIMNDLNYVMSLKAQHINNIYNYVMGIAISVYITWVFGTYVGFLVADRLPNNIVIGLAYAGIMYLGMLVLMLVRANDGFKSPLMIASVASLCLYLLDANQAITMLGAVLAGGAFNFWLEVKKRRKSYNV